MAASVTLANAKVSIDQALRWAEAEPGYGKLHCPFGPVAHSDGGVERSLRTYDTNTAHCFSCKRTWTPVSMMSEWWDCSREEAAEKMLRLSGITQPGWQEKWEQAHQPRPPDLAALGEALKTWCRRMLGPSWEQEQFDPRLAVPLGHCLGMLSRVTTADEAEEWLNGSKSVMMTVVKLTGGG